MKFNNENRQVNLDIPHLDGPRYQSVRVLTADYYRYMNEIVDFMVRRLGSRFSDPLFREIELKKIQRIWEWMRSPTEGQELAKMRKDFYLFFKQHDERRGTDFLMTFPEMEEFWNFCRNQ